MVFLNTMKAMFLSSVKFQNRVPSIKFRKGGLAPAVTGSAAPQVKQSNGKTTTELTKAGVAQTVVLEELPARLRRKPLSAEEIEYINNGGVP